MNGSRARQPIQELILLVRADDQTAQVQAGDWNVSRASGQVRDTGSPITPGAPLEMSAPPGQAIAAGAQGYGFSVASSYLPGFTPISAKGA